jgi:hypothetical protein
VRQRDGRLPGVGGPIELEGQNKRREREEKDRERNSTDDDSGKDSRGLRQQRESNSVFFITRREFS